MLLYEKFGEKSPVWIIREEKYHEIDINFLVLLLMAKKKYIMSKLMKIRKGGLL